MPARRMKRSSVSGPPWSGAGAERSPSGTPCGGAATGSSSGAARSIRGIIGSRRRRLGAPSASNQGMDHRGPIVIATDLWRRYGEGEAAVNALAGVSAAFERGQFSAIMGPSGSGKSTLLHVLAGLDRPTSGSVVLDGTELTTLDDGELTRLRRDKLGFVFQFFNLIPVLTAEENVLLPLSIAGREPDRAWLEQLLHTVGLEDRGDGHARPGGRGLRGPAGGAPGRAGGPLGRRRHRGRGQRAHEERGLDGPARAARARGPQGAGGDDHARRLPRRGPDGGGLRPERQHQRLVQRPL